MKRQRQRMSPERALRILRADAHRLGLTRARERIAEVLGLNSEGEVPNNNNHSPHPPGCFQVGNQRGKFESGKFHAHRNAELVRLAQQRLLYGYILPREVVCDLTVVTDTADQEEYDRLVRIDQTPQCCRSTMCAQPSHRPNPNPNRAARRLNPNEAFPGPTLRYRICTGGWICPWTNKRPNDDELYGMIQMGWQVP